MITGEKESSKLGAESEKAEGARNFILSALPFDLAAEKRNELTGKELLGLYAEVVNSEPTIDALKKIAGGGRAWPPIRIGKQISKDFWR